MLIFNFHPSYRSKQSFRAAPKLIVYSTVMAPLGARPPLGACLHRLFVSPIKYARGPVAIGSTDHQLH